MPPEAIQRLSSEGVLAVVLVAAFLQAGVQITTSLITFLQKKRGPTDDPVLNAIGQLASTVGRLTDAMSRIYEGQEHNEVTLNSLAVQLQDIRTSLVTINTKLDFILTNRSGRPPR